MKINVSGKRLDVGDALRSHVDDRLTLAAGKYFANPIEARVVFTREGNGYRADCSVHVGHGIEAHSRAEASEIYASFDAAAERLEKQLRRYKRRLRDHHNNKQRGEEPSLPALDYVIQPEPEHEEASEAFQPVIVAERATDIHTLSVGEAVMQLDLGEQPVVMFRNRQHGQLNVVYRRPDGHIGWLDLGRNQD